MEIQEIKKYMKSNHITYEQLAQRSGLSISTIKKIFSGIAQYPRIDTMQAIEKALGLNTAPLQWTEADKALGVGSHPVKLTEKEWRILEAFNELERVKGEAFSEKMLEMIEAIPALPEKK